MAKTFDKKCVECLEDFVSLHWRAEFCDECRPLAKSSINYWKRFRIRVRDLKEMLINQSDECQICNKTIDLKTLNVDHCHESGKIRGLLCWNCNVGIGNLGDSVKTLQNAVNYLRKYKE